MECLLSYLDIQQFHNLYIENEGWFNPRLMLQKLDAAGVPAGPINSIGDVFADPQIIARGMELKIENPLSASGFTPGVRAPIVMDGQALCAPLPAPGLGQHNDEVLSDVNWGG